MAAIIGLDDAEIVARCRDVTGTHGEVAAVNFNSPGQVVIAGRSPAVDEAIRVLKEAGAKRAMPLPVSAPFHTDLMRPAGEKLEQAIAEITIRAPKIPVVHNVHCQTEDDPERIRGLLVEQIYSPVKMDGLRPGHGRRRRYADCRVRPRQGPGRPQPAHRPVPGKFLPGGARGPASHPRGPRGRRVNSQAQEAAMTEHNKTALVTGASRGIGRAIAEQLAADGFTVVGTATSDAGATAIGEYLETGGFSGCGMRLDVADDDSVSTVVKAVGEKYGAPLVLINNAGITRDNILMRMKSDEWSDVIDTNLNALYRVSKACLRGMTKARWGRIVNITSVVGAMGNIGQSNYAATKAGAEGFSRALARELGSRSVTVNSVAPGFIDTDMTRELSDEQRELMLGQIPLGRLGEPREIAALVAFLCSDVAGYITGETLHINGGMYMA